MNDTLAPLRHFVQSMTALVDRAPTESELLQEGRDLLARLIARDDWLPDAYAAPRTDRYAQYLLHCDPQERFSVVSFVWAAGQCTPVHNHTVWGLVGVLRGSERCDEFDWRDGRPHDLGRSHCMTPGAIEAVSPTVGDWHRVSAAVQEGVAVSIHVYGANIGAVRRHRLDAEGHVIDFVSGYDNTSQPNLWDRSASVRAQAGLA